MSTDKAAFERAVQAHDEAVKRHRVAIWVGSEPTFTDRRSEAAEWLTEALGASKEQCARRMLAQLQDSFGGVVLRTVGRQYPKEERPRWSFGLYRRRDGQPLWSGPPDPLLNAGDYQTGQLKAFWKALTGLLGAKGWPAVRFRLKEPNSRRIAFRRDGRLPVIDLETDPRLRRPSIHVQPIPPIGLRDPLAEDGTYLVAIGRDKQNSTDRAIWVEMPAFPEVEFFLQFLSAVAEAADRTRLTALILKGYPPPLDASVSWTTLTPDPAVVEINMAPAPDASTFLAWSQIAFAVAEQTGLAPYRLHYNGQLTDSGGGGQITLGGPDPEHSPFLCYPSLLPNLVRYFNRHPSLSFYFACDFIGGTSQSPRADERLPEAFEELCLALELLARQKNPKPDILWSSLAPFLADLAGSMHRSEINIEKLWNPYLPGRGRLGLVEFRAFRMPPTPEKAAALAVLLRAITVMLSDYQGSLSLVKWGSELHDRFALPFYLRRDLHEVLSDLAQAGLGLEHPISAELLEDSYYQLTSIPFSDCRLSIKRALEFWPLVGDTAAQEYGGSRLVDASTARLEISLRPLAGAENHLTEWSLLVDGYRLPLCCEDDAEGPALVFGLRYRRYRPWHGLHPTLDARGFITMVLYNARRGEALKITYYEWKPRGGGYDGLPADLAEACRRREERCVIEPLACIPDDKGSDPPTSASTPYCLDLRKL